ncbi:hypothetical protein [Mucilaginibacter flavus]|uniref:hypothetical protein n=1 Tax=Mucilaginibacter flavus TaxID=931504 RepID=UPI0025B2D939|nr:hypothetical protein [Mucilaginibacter flavus]MDN3584726.1 hypothetical protein [Mucilaginibacter flavus]
MKKVLLLFLLVIPFKSHSQVLDYFRSDTTDKGAFNEYITIIVPPVDNDKGEVFYLNSTSKEVIKLSTIKDTLINGCESSVVVASDSPKKYLLVLAVDGQKLCLTFKGDQRPRFFDLQQKYRAFELPNSQRNNVVRRSPSLSFGDIKTMVTLLSFFL